MYSELAPVIKQSLRQYIQTERAKLNTLPRGHHWDLLVHKN